MAIWVLFLMNLIATKSVWAETQQFSFAVQKQDRLVLAYPNLEVELYYKNQKNISLEVEAAFTVPIVKEGEEFRIKSADIEGYLGKGSQAPLLKVKVYGDLPVRISSLGVGVKSDSWRSALQVDSLKGQLVFSGVARGANLRLEQGNVTWKSGSGELHLKCGACEVMIQKHRGNTQVDQLAGSLDIQEIFGSQILRMQKVKSLIAESNGRIEAAVEEGSLEIAKISGFAEVSSIASKISIRPGAEAQISLLDKKSKIEIKNEAPLWVDLNTEEGSISAVEPFKPQRTSFETVLKGPLTAGSPRTRVLVKTQSGQISVK